LPEKQPWVAVETDHFTIYSQLLAGETIDLAGQLETFRELTRLVTNAGDQAYASPIPTIVYVFNGSGAYRNFAPPRSAGFIAPRQRANFIALDGRSRGLGATRIIYHEFVHYLLRNGSTSAYPAWFDEGFAEYLGATRIDDDFIYLGDIPEDRIPQLLYDSPLPIRQICEASDLSGWSARNSALFYAQSWALMHYLQRGRDAKTRDAASDDSGDGTSDAGGSLRPLQVYIQRLNEGTASSLAFEEAFGVTYHQMGRELQRYISLGALSVTRIPRGALPVPEVGSARAVSKAEIATRLGELALFSNARSQAGRLFQVALTEEPDAPRALAGLASVLSVRGGAAGVEALFERAVELDPEDALNHLDLAEHLLAQVPGDGPATDAERAMLRSARDHFARAIELDPDLPEAYAQASRIYAFPEQDWEKGLPLIEAAYSLLRSDTEISSTLARFYMEAERYDEAGRLLDVASQWAAESGTAQALTTLQAELTRRLRASEDQATDEAESTP
jgi:tetratricopeptide (TPR) repeat protein